MDARFDCYTYRAPKMGVSEMPSRCNKYLKEYQTFKKLYKTEFSDDSILDNEKGKEGPVNPFA